MMRDVDHAGSIIGRLMHAPGFKERWTDHLIHAKWEEWVGSRIARCIKPLRFRGGQLTLMADDERWEKAFEEFKESIHEKMVRDIGIQEITFIVLVGTKGDRDDPEHGMPDQGHVPPPEHPHTHIEPLSQVMEEELRRVTDPSLRETLRRAIQTSLSSDR